MDNVYFCPHAFVLFKLLICCDKYKNIISQQTNNLFWYSKFNCFLYMCLFIMLFCFRLGESCSHVAALLFKVEAAVRLGYTSRACTELPCYWNNDFVKKVKPAPVHSIQFYKKSATKTVSQRNRYATPSIATDREKKQLLDSLASCSRRPQSFRETLPSILLEGNSRTGAIATLPHIALQAGLCQHDPD